MKRITVKNFNGIGEASIELKKINVIIGSNKKEQFMRVIDFCSWVEWRIIITGSSEEFEKSGFECFLNSYYNFWLDNDTKITYETDNVIFSYDNENHEFVSNIKSSYIHRLIVDYVPVERNIAFSNWYRKVDMDNNYVFNFFINLEAVKRGLRDNEIFVDEIGVSYVRDQDSLSDFIVSGDIKMTANDALNEIKSYLALFLFLMYARESMTSINLSIEISNFLGICEKNKMIDVDEIKKQLLHPDRHLLFIENIEQGLRPEKQVMILDRMVNFVNNGKNEIYFTTDSPYVINHMALCVKGYDVKEKIKSNYDMENLKNIIHSQVVANDVMILQLEEKSVSEIKPWYEGNCLNEAIQFSADKFNEIMDVEENIPTIFQY